MVQKFVFKVDDKEKVKIKHILNSYGHNGDNLISILQKIQELYGFLPRNVIYYLSRKLKIPIAEIYFFWYA